MSTRGFYLPFSEFYKKTSAKMTKQCYERNAGFDIYSYGCILRHLFNL